MSGRCCYTRRGCSSWHGVGIKPALDGVTEVAVVLYK